MTTTPTPMGGININTNDKHNRVIIVEHGFSKNKSKGNEKEDITDAISTPNGTSINEEHDPMNMMMNPLHCMNPLHSSMTQLQ